MHEAKWIFSFLGRSKYKLYSAYVMSLLFNALLAANTVIISRIADDVLTPMFENHQIPTSEVMRQMLPLLILALIIGITAALFRFLSNIFREQASQKVTFDLRNALYQKLGLQTRDFFLSNRSGDLINKCSGDVDVCNHFLSARLHRCAAHGQGRTPDLRRCQTAAVPPQYCGTGKHCRQPRGPGFCPRALRDRKVP